MLVDEAKITVVAGHGGAGLVHFLSNRQNFKGGPDGGNGGDGADIYLLAVSDISRLKRYKARTRFLAPHGGRGGPKDQTGARASDLVLEVPVGTQVRLIEKKQIYDLVKIGQKILIAKGGRGGRGNTAFKSSRNTTPRNSEPGQEGETVTLAFDLKLIADFGLIGLPNAGKSSLLNVLTNANVRVANYPFTTLEPNLGVLPNTSILADIPGLIEGASSGKGLGHRFLKHIERTKTLIHCLSSESLDLKKDYQTIRRELQNFNLRLTKKKEIILLTKVDLLSINQLTDKLKTLKKLNPLVYPISIHHPSQIKKISDLLCQL
jgi:GTPase